MILRIEKSRNKITKHPPTIFWKIEHARQKPSNVHCQVRPFIGSNLLRIMVIVAKKEEVE